MANIMSMVKLRNRTSRNGFDLSRRNAFTAKVGELLPVACIECIPGDKFDLRVQHFTRTVPVSTAAYTRIREYYDWFFVPTNLLWNKFNTFATQMTKNVQHSASASLAQTISDRHPYFTTNQLTDYINYVERGNYRNLFGFKRSFTTLKLLEYLGYGVYSGGREETPIYNKQNLALNPFPLLAYQKIYQDYFRNSQWEDSYAPSFNVDYINSSPQIPVDNIMATAITHENMFDLRYCNWHKDIFMGLLPNSQYGDAASINAGSGNGTINIGASSDFETSQLYYKTDGPSQSNVPPLLASSASYENTYYLCAPADGAANPMRPYLTASQISQLRASMGLSSSSANVSVNTAFSILALRQAEALQKWKEITQSQQQDYKSQIEAHFGVSLSDAYSDRCHYIDGTVSTLDISEVVNTNITGDNASDVAGKGVGVGDGRTKFGSDVHGYLMCIYHAVPLLDYSSQGVSRMHTKTLATDYAIPEFDATGMVSVPITELTNSSETPTFTNTMLGYAPRYYDYKISKDTVHGAFRGTYGHWVAPISDSYLQSYLSSLGTNQSVFNYRFFKVNPAVLNPIFSMEVDAGSSSDQLLINASFDIKAVRNLDRNGLPY